jgi:hypothetical protein
LLPNPAGRDRMAHAASDQYQLKQNDLQDDLRSSETADGLSFLHASAVCTLENQRLMPMWD